MFAEFAVLVKHAIVHLVKCLTSAAMAVLPQASQTAAMEQVNWPIFCLLEYLIIVVYLFAYFPLLKAVDNFRKKLHPLSLAGFCIRLGGMQQ